MTNNNHENGIRLNKYIADSGFCSRREADRLIDAGQVQIDGRVGVLGDKVFADMRVTVGGQEVAIKTRKVYIALNKPVGIVCTADPREPMNVVDYVAHPERIFPIGRLDKDSSGLLLMTSDGEIVNKLLRAVGRHEKEYVVSVDRPLTREFLRRMAEGVPILDTVTLPARIFQIAPQRFRLIIVQGLNRQIRRMCEALGYRVTSLRRIRIMNIELGELAPGQYRDLTELELNTLMNDLNEEYGGIGHGISETPRR